MVRAGELGGTTGMTVVSCGRVRVKFETELNVIGRAARGAEEGGIGRAGSTGIAGLHGWRQRLNDFEQGN